MGDFHPYLPARSDFYHDITGSTVSVSRTPIDFYYC